MLPSKDDFVAKHFHLMFGLMVDCLTWSERDATNASRRITQMRARLETELNLMYDQLIPPNRPAPDLPKGPPAKPAMPGNPPPKG